MGMAFRAPNDLYRRHYSITDHALQRLRERLPDDLKNAHRDNLDLGNALDSAAFEAVQLEHYEHIQDHESPAMLVHLSSSAFGEDLCAVLKPDKFAKKGAPDKFIVTVLTEEQAKNNKANGRWGWEHRDSPGAGMVSMRDQLKAAAATIALSPPPAAKTAPEPPSALEPEPDLPPFVPPEPDQSVLTPELAAMRLLAWPTEDEKGREVQAFVNPRDAGEHFATLVDEEGVDTSDIGSYQLALVWVPTKKRKIVVEL